MELIEPLEVLLVFNCRIIALSLEKDIVDVMKMNIAYYNATEWYDGGRWKLSRLRGKRAI